MEPNETEFNKLEAYTENQLSTPERLAFETQLAQEPTLRAQLTDYQQLRHTFDSVGLANKLAQIGDELEADGEIIYQFPAAEPVRSVHWRWVSAASVVFLLGLSWFLWQRPTPAEQTFEAFYRPEMALKGADECSPALRTAIQAYRNGQYAEALRQLQTQPASDACTPYYRGLAQLGLSESEEAIRSLEKARKMATSPSLQHRADWYLALAFLRANQPDAARQRLQLIRQQPNHSFDKVADEALHTLNL